MLEPGKDFSREDSVPRDVIDYYSKYEIKLEGWGVVAGEPCTFLVLDPNVTILAHQRVPDSHPEAMNHLWAAQLSLPDGKTYRILFSWNGSFLFLFARSSWNEFSPVYSDLIKRARQVEDGSTPRPDVSAARVEFERFLSKHREVWRPRDISNPDDMRLIREYRRLATICMEKLERMPS